VLVPHRGLVNFLGWCVQAYAADGRGGAPLFSSVAFDMVVPNLFTPLLIGQRVCIVPETVGLDELGAALTAHAPFAFVKLTPGQLEVLAGQLPSEAAARLAEVVVVGADAFPSHALRYWQGLDPPPVLLNEYGPTEASVANCVQRVDGEVTSELVPIGKPIPNTSMHVLDEAMSPTPVGVAGELYIGGDCVVRGYLGRPALTAERFVPDPLSGHRGARLYRTGDRGRLRADGNFEFLGRVDQQIKIRGYRVEPAEIELALTGHPDIDRAIVTADVLSDGGRRLVGHLVLRPDVPTPTSVDLRQFLSAKLPDYMIPAAYTTLDAVPLNANGKLDRGALPAGPARPYDSPSTPMQELLVGIWADVLDLEPADIGINDNFFDLGGHSILVLELLARIRDAIPSGLTLEHLFAATTIAATAEILERLPSGGADSTGSSLVRLGNAGRHDPIVLVHPVGGTISCYGALVKWLGADRPVFGLSAQAPHGDEPGIPESFEGMVARYVLLLEKEGLHGSFVLAGWSTGGLAAHELARQMSAKGHEVGNLVLIDPPDPPDPENWSVYRQRLMEFDRLEQRLSELEDEPSRRRLFLSAIDQGVFDDFGVNQADLRARTDTVLQDMLAVWGAQLRLLAGYEPGSFAGTTTLILSQEVPSPNDHARRWAELTVGNCSTEIVEGDHLSVLREPYVGWVGEIIQRSIG
jgi:thioesterase domain-containing protein/acyl carrier protein